VSEFDAACLRATHRQALFNPGMQIGPLSMFGTLMA